MGGWVGTTKRACGVVATAGLAAAIWAPAASAESKTWFNTVPITFSGTEAGPGSGTPSSIQVTGQEGPITDVDLNVNAIDMNDLGALQILLVSPSGETEVAKARYCNGQSADNLILTFDQQAGGELYWSDSPTCVDDSYKPTSSCRVFGCPWWDSIAGGADSANFDNFNGENANGTWLLYVWRQCSNCPTGGDEIGAGWSLSIDTGGHAIDLPAGSGNIGIASPYPDAVQVGGTGLITDVNVTLRGVFHGFPADLDVMLEGPGGQRVMLMSDACGGYDVNAYIWTWNDEAPFPMAGGGTGDVCGSPSHRPTDYQPGDSLPAPAPQAPYGTSLSVFDLTEPAGTWRLWIADDSVGNEGFITNNVQLDIQTRARAQTAFATSAVTVGEGDTAELTVTRSGATSYTDGSVQVTSSPGTAGAGDFAPISRRLEFAPGQTEKTVEVAVAADTEAEGPEAFTISLSSPTGDAALGTPRDATVTVPADPDPVEAGGPDTGGSADTTPPDTSIAAAPKAKTPKRKARLEFASSEPGSTFECKLDRTTFEACDSPVKLKKLHRGKHRFQVRAMDAAGNIDPTPAKVRWKVV